MLNRTGEMILFGGLFGIGASSVVLSILLLRRGKLYRRLSPNARPRRWVLIFVLALFAVFVVWFPVWLTWPHAPISRVLTAVFSVTFFVVSMALKWLSGLMARYWLRKGWPVRSVPRLFHDEEGAQG
jgi:hypothetical protein